MIYFSHINGPDAFISALEEPRIPAYYPKKTDDFCANCRSHQLKCGLSITTKEEPHSLRGRV